MVKTKKNEKEEENDEEIFFNNIEMKSYDTEDDLKTQIDVNPDYFMSFDLNNVGNIDIGISNDTDNFLEGKDLDECLRNDE